MTKSYVQKTKKSKRLYERAKRVLPAGVSYILRFMEPYPIYTARAGGSKLFDVDGNEYVDFWMGHHALIFGHSPPEVMREVRRQLNNGTHYGTSHELEIALAEQVAKMVPNVQMIRFTNSGTEANMYATRLARTVTGRDRIAKFEGGWHGGYDALQKAVKAPFDVPESGGLTESTLKDTVVLPFNNIGRVREALKTQKLAGVFVEPVLGAAGCIPAGKGFLEELKELCSDNGTLLIFDEVITGFRLSPGGAQELFDVEADITVFGKILGGGFPIGAIAGPEEIMERMDALRYERPEFSFQGGTFCANPITMIAGLTTLRMLEDGHILKELNAKGERLRRQLGDAFDRANEAVQVTGVSSLWHTHFTKEEVIDANVAAKADVDKLVRYHTHLIENGMFFLPTKTGSLSTAHSEADLQKLLAETEGFFKDSSKDKRRV
jgi:glutamate-1-semialdehyde 2,1-aminomutase